MILYSLSINFCVQFVYSSINLDATEELVVLNQDSVDLQNNFNSSFYDKKGKSSNTIVNENLSKGISKQEERDKSLKNVSETIHFRPSTNNENQNSETCNIFRASIECLERLYQEIRIFCDWDVFENLEYPQMKERAGIIHNLDEIFVKIELVLYDMYLSTIKYFDECSKTTSNKLFYDDSDTDISLEKICISENGIDNEITPIELLAGNRFIKSNIKVYSEQNKTFFIEDEFHKRFFENFESKTAFSQKNVYQDKQFKFLEFRKINENRGFDISIVSPIKEVSIGFRISLLLQKIPYNLEIQYLCTKYSTIYKSIQIFCEKLLENSEKYLHSELIDDLRCINFFHVKYIFSKISWISYIFKKSRENIHINIQKNFLDNSISLKTHGNFNHSNNSAFKRKNDAIMDFHKAKKTNITISVEDTISQNIKTNEKVDPSINHHKKNLNTDTNTLNNVPINIYKPARCDDLLQSNPNIPTETLDSAEQYKSKELTTLSESTPTSKNKTSIFKDSSESDFSMYEQIFSIRIFRRKKKSYMIFRDSLNILYAKTIRDIDNLSNADYRGALREHISNFSFMFFVKILEENDIDTRFTLFCNLLFEIIFIKQFFKKETFHKKFWQQIEKECCIFKESDKNFPVILDSRVEMEAKNYKSCVTDLLIESIRKRKISRKLSENNRCSIYLNVKSLDIWYFDRWILHLLFNQINAAFSKVLFNASEEKSKVDREFCIFLIVKLMKNSNYHLTFSQKEFWIYRRELQPIIDGLFKKFRDFVKKNEIKKIENILSFYRLCVKYDYSETSQKYNQIRAKEGIIEFSAPIKFYRNLYHN